MKKNLITSIIISIVINVICTLTNFICAHFFDFLPLGLKTDGGEYISYSGFGILLEKFYSLSLPEDAKYSSKVSFNILSFIIYFIIIFIIVFLIIYLIKKFKNKKKEK